MNFGILLIWIFVSLIAGISVGHLIPLKGFDENIVVECPFQAEPVNKAFTELYAEIGAPVGPVFHFVDGDVIKQEQFLTNIREATRSLKNKYKKKFPIPDK